MDAASHDLLVGGIGQNARVLLLEAFAIVMEKNGLNAKDLYAISSPPDKDFT